MAMKRFWTRAAAAGTPEGLEIRLDDKPVRLPGGTPLRVAAPALAAALAAEWDAAGGAHGGEFRPDDVPLTRLVGTAQERIAPDPAPVVAGIAAYGGTDLLCYRAEDPALAERQAAEWQPLLDWAALHLDAPLRVTVGVMPLAQAPQALGALHRAVAAEDAYGLAALGLAVPALGSLVLGLALAGGRLAAAEAHQLATLDERYQEALWGSDAEVLARRERIGSDIALAERLLRLVRG